MSIVSVESLNVAIDPISLATGKPSFDEMAVRGAVVELDAIGNAEPLKSLELFQSMASLSAFAQNIKEQLEGSGLSKISFEDISIVSNKRKPLGQKKH